MSLTESIKTIEARGWNWSIASSPYQRGYSASVNPNKAWDEEPDVGSGESPEEALAAAYLKAVAGLAARLEARRERRHWQDESYREWRDKYGFGFGAGE